jgi:hypothetical protein
VVVRAPSRRRRLPSRRRARALGPGLLATLGIVAFALWALGP